MPEQMPPPNHPDPDELRGDGGVEQIKAELAAATPGPWDSCGMDDADWIKPDQEYAVTVWKRDAKGNGRAVACDVMKEADATLIAHAPTYLAALLDVAAAAQRMRASSNVTRQSSNRIWADFDKGYVDKFTAALDRLAALPQDHPNG